MSRSTIQFNIYRIKDTIRYNRQRNIKYNKNEVRSNDSKGYYLAIIKEIFFLQWESDFRQHIPKLKRISFKMVIIKKYCVRQCFVEKVLAEMLLG